MATYISLINYTDQGIRTVKDTVDRAEAAKQLASGMGRDPEHHLLDARVI